MIPNPTRPDYYWENQYYLDDEQADRKAMDKAAKTSAKNTAIWISAIFSILQVCFLWSGVLLTAYLILKDTSIFISAVVWKKAALLVGTTYLLNCLVFFLKGIMTALRAANRKTWMLLWVVNSCFVCLPPAILVYVTMDSLLAPTTANPAGRSPNYALWSIGAAVVTAYLVYVKFGLGNNRVMQICNWAFCMGYRAAK